MSVARSFFESPLAARSISTSHRWVPEPSAVRFLDGARFMVRKYLNVKILDVKSKRLAEACGCRQDVAPRRRSDDQDYPPPPPRLLHQLMRLRDVGQGNA